MEYDLIFKLSLLAVLLVLSGFFSGSEASIFSLTSLHLHKMKEEKIPFSASVRKLLKRPRRLLVTIIAGNESINVAIAALTTSIFIYIFGAEGKWMAIAAATITLIIFGEAIPKTFAVTHPIRFSSAVALPLTLFSGLLRPMVWSLEKISDLSVSLFGRQTPAGEKGLTEDAFKALVDAGHKEGALEESQKDLIHRVFELADTKVSDIMIPRVDMFCLPISMNIQEVEREIIKARASRIPVYGTDRDDIVGILHAKHLLAGIAGGGRDVNWHHLLKKPFFVPLEKRADEMLRDFQTRRLQMAMVVDEYGGVAGLVTLNDILRNL
ncbi:HlyC/CorC family transporter, partial [Candidatus Babeliales bacterium]|nr:HlyC/CorC family transporter [Candidatus Babeliales bacterium]